MKQEFACPNGHSLRVASRRDLAAVKVRCPKCGVVFVPSPADAVTEHATIPPALLVEEEDTREAATLPPPFPRDEQATLPPARPTEEQATLPPRPDEPEATELETLPPPAASNETLAYSAGKSSTPGEVPGYEILSELGRGGMGVVYKAKQTKLNRVVALKMILGGGHAGAAELDRFRTEAEAIARLQHPNIVQIHEIGEHEGLPFFSLEYCSGGSLDRKLAGTPMKPEEAAALVEKLARAMHAAHENGVIHRDLKPANVLLSPSPKITDFGLAKKLDEQGKTATGAVMGTPSYMAPEQAGGKSHEIGPACDIYALGAILYDCLTGRPPFRAATPLDTILQVVSEEPAPVSRINGQVPRDLETICHKCLRKDQTKRYPTALALADDLKRFLRGEPIRARPIGKVERFRKWVRRNPAIAGLLSLLVLGLVVLVGGAIWFSVELMEERNEALKQTKLAEDRERDEAIAKKQAQEQLDRAEWLLYGGKIREAQLEWATGNAWNTRLVLQDCPVERRGWEHDLQYSNLHLTPRLMFHGHIHTWCFSPDGKRMVTAGGGLLPDMKAEMKIWDFATGKLLVNVPSLHSAVMSVVFSRDGKQMATVHADFSIVLRNGQSGDVQKVFARLLLVGSVCFSPDGKNLATHGHDGIIRIWDLATQKVVRSFKEQPHVVGNLLEYSPDGKWLAANERNGLVVWNPETGKEVFRAKGQARSVTFSPDGVLFAATVDKEVRLWNTDTWKLVRSMPGYGPTFSSDGKRIAGRDEKGNVHVWATETGEEVALLDVGVHGPYATAARITPDGKGIALQAGSDVKVWDIDRGTGSIEIKNLGRSFAHVSFRPDGERLACSTFCPDGKPGSVAILDLKQRRSVLDIPMPVCRMMALAWSPDGARLATRTDNGLVALYDATTGKQLHSLKLGHNNPEPAIEYSPDGKYIAVNRSVETLLLDGKTGRQVHSLLPMNEVDPAVRIAFSADGKYLATGANLKIRIWNVAEGSEVSVIPFESFPQSVCFSPDGTRIAVGSNAGIVDILDLAERKVVRRLQTRMGTMKYLAWTNDGRRLVTASPQEKMVKFWELQAGQEVCTLRLTGTPLTIQFSRDGRKLACPTMEKDLIVWETSVRMP